MTTDQKVIGLNPIGITKPRSFTPGLFLVSPSRTYSNEGPTGQRKIPVGLHFIVRPRHKASGAGFCRCRRDFVTRFLLKTLVSICVIAFDVNFIEDTKSVAIGDFCTNEHPDEPKNIHITNRYPIDYTDLKQNVNMLITLFLYGSEHIEK